MRYKTNNPRRTAWLLVGAGAAMVAGRLVDRGLEKGWRSWQDDDPPDPKRDSWSKALAWTALSGAAVATAELVARRGAHVGLRRLTGKRTPAGL